MLDESDLMTWWLLMAEGWARWHTTHSQLSGFCSHWKIFIFAVILWNPTPYKAVAEENSEKRLCTSQEHRKYKLKARPVSPCVNSPGVHIRGCQHLYGLWIKESACSELGTPARQRLARQAQQSGCSLASAPQKKNQAFLQLKDSWPVTETFIYNLKIELVWSSSPRKQRQQKVEQAGMDLAVAVLFPFSLLNHSC